MTAWYNEPISHGYYPNYDANVGDTPHFAYDLATPFHTSLTAILPGTVEKADYAAWGGEIFIKPDDSSKPEYYFYHPDEVDVQVGQHVSAGQFIGLSGGENPGYPGAEHPAQPQWSTGPHTHVGWFERWQSTPIGTRPYGHEPSDLLAMAHSGGYDLSGNTLLASSSTASASNTACPTWLPAPLCTIWQGAQNATNPNVWANTIFADVSLSAGSFFMRLGVGAVGVTLIALGAYEIVDALGIIDKAQAAGQQIGKVAEVAAV
jgi:hypothetical protein